MMLILCYDFKLREPHAFMYVMYIGILPHYVILVWTHTFDIYVRHDIIRACPFSMASGDMLARCALSNQA